MIIQPPCNEAARLDALRRYQILYTAPEEVFDSLTRLAAAICGTPIAVISLIDEQRLWFKSKIGFSQPEIARDQASCIHAAIQGSGEIFIVPDTLLDERFSNNLLVTAKPHVRFFAGVPLITSEGHALGTLCVMDLVPRELNDDQQEALRALTQEVLVHFELRRKNLQLQPIRERLDLILNATGEGIYGLDADGLTTFINPAAVRMLGWTAEELLGRPLHELLHHTSPAEYCPLDAGFKDSRLHQVDDAVFLRKDGTGFPVAYTSSPITQDGMQLGMAVIFQDITKRKQLEDLAEKKQQFLDVLLDNLEEGIVACDADGILTLFNSATRRFTGLLEQPIPPEQWAEYYNVYAPDGKTLMRTEELPLYRALHGEIVHNAEFVIAPKHGPARTLCANGQALFDAHGKKLGAVIAMRNITETQRIEQELRENEERYRTLYDDNPAMYFTLDADGKILLVNARGAEQLGYTVEELIGQPVLNVFYEGDKETVLKEFKACLQRPGEIAQWEFRKVRKGGSIIWVNETVRPIISGNGDIIVLVVCENINDRKLAEAQLIYAANYDALTNLPNRTLLYDRLGQAVVRVPWNKRLVAVLFLDIDRFKLINDTLGHSIADLLLSAIGERLTACVREGDTVARLGGDEFAVILADVARLKDVTLVAEKVLASLALPYDLDGQEVFTSASIGISLCPNDGEDVTTLLKHADWAMYAAKKKNGNTYQYYSAIKSMHISGRLLLEAALHHALQRDEFTLNYQPILNLADGCIVGVEALLRWNRPEGLMSPAQFIQLAEETGLIVPIGEWVLRTACTQIKAWQTQGLPLVRVAVNVSARQIQQPNIKIVISHILQETQLEPRYLELELTEGIMQSPQAAGVLRALEETGVSISIDDFGTGYSSLSYLKRFPLDKLKIDQSFMRGIPEDQDNAAIVTAIIAMAHSLKLKVIAEGVETDGQLEFLRSLNCDEVQGFLLSHPLTAADMSLLLATEQLKLPN